MTEWKCTECQDYDCERLLFCDDCGVLVCAECEYDHLLQHLSMMEYDREEYEEEFDEVLEN